MNFGKRLRRYWPELLLVMAVALPWLCLLALGMVWLWQGGHVWAWAIAAAALALLAWPLSRLVRQRANAEARVALGDIAEPERGWNVIEREAWDDVLAIADATAPFDFTEIEPLLDERPGDRRGGLPPLSSAGTQRLGALQPARGPAAHRAALARRAPRGAAPHPRDQGVAAQPPSLDAAADRTLWRGRGAGWRVGFGLWRLLRAVLNPVQAVGQETSGLFVEKTASVLSYRLRAYATRMFVLEVGRAAIDLYSGRLALSDEELRAARERDVADAAAPAAPVRIVLIGQVNAGKSSLLNALAQEVRGAVGPVPTTARAQNTCSSWKAIRR